MRPVAKCRVSCRYCRKVRLVARDPGDSRALRQRSRRAHMRDDCVAQPSRARRSCGPANLIRSHRRAAEVLLLGGVLFQGGVLRAPTLTGSTGGGPCNQPRPVALSSGRRQRAMGRIGVRTRWTASASSSQCPLGCALQRAVNGFAGGEQVFEDGSGHPLGVLESATARGRAVQSRVGCRDG